MATGSIRSPLEPHIRAAALDLDGTLLRSDRTLSRFTIDTVKQLAERGVIPILATGRSVETTLPFMKALGITSPVVCCNGAYVFDGATGRALLHYPLEEEISREIVRCSREFDLFLHAFSADRLLFEPGSEEADEYERSSRFTGNTVDFDALPRLGFTKAMYIGERERIDTIRSRLERLFGSRIYMVYTLLNYFEMMDGKVNKQRALALVLESLGISSNETMAIGDGDNDLEMLTWAACGVAMDNSSDRVKSAVPLRTTSNDQDGAARFLAEYFALPARSDREDCEPALAVR